MENTKARYTQIQREKVEEQREENEIDGDIRTCE